LFYIVFKSTSRENEGVLGIEVFSSSIVEVGSVLVLDLEEDSSSGEGARAQQTLVIEINRSRNEERISGKNNFLEEVNLDVGLIGTSNGNFVISSVGGLSVESFILFSIDDTLGGVHSS